MPTENDMTKQIPAREAEATGRIEEGAERIKQATSDAVASTKETVNRTADRVEEGFIAPPTRPPAPPRGLPKKPPISASAGAKPMTMRWIKPTCGWSGRANMCARNPYSRSPSRLARAGY